MHRENLEVTDQLVEFMAGQLVFRSVPEERLRAVLKNCHLVQVQPDEIIIRKGESYQKGVYLVVSGVIALDAGQNNADAVPGDMLGLTSFIGKSTYNLSAVASDKTRLLFIPEICIYKLMEDFEDFRRGFHQLVSTRIAFLTGSGRMSVVSSTYKPVGSYMSSPVVTICCEASVVDASRLMSEHMIGSLAVVDTSGEIVGVVTAKGLVHSFLANVERHGIEAGLTSFVDEKPIILPQEFPLVEALAEMQLKGHDYAIVVKAKKPVGIVSSKDIMRLLFSNINVYNVHVEHIESLDELAEAHSGLFRIAASLMDNSRLTTDILPVLSAVHINIQKRVYRLTVEECVRELGSDPTDIRHSLMIMGSGGRREMMLDPDQDNGVIFADEVTDEEIEAFAAFGRRFVDNLAAVGYERCKGNVMVTNPDMAKRLSDWKTTIVRWVNGAGASDILWSNIIFDFDGFVGDEKLVWELRDYIHRKVGEKPVFLIQMLEKDSNLKVPISLFNKFLVEKEGEHQGTIHMKPSVMGFIVDVTRAFGLFAGINDLSTVERLKHLGRKKILSEETVYATLNAYETVVDIVLNEQIRKAESGEPVNKYVDPHALSRFNQEKLKDAINHVQKFLSTGLRYFKGHP